MVKDEPGTELVSEQDEERNKNEREQTVILPSTCPVDCNSTKHVSRHRRDLPQDAVLAGAQALALEVLQEPPLA